MPRSIATQARNLPNVSDLFNHRWARLALNCFLVAAAYYIAAALSFSFRVPATHSSIIWAPNAILLTFFLFTPANKWWLWVLAAVPAHLLAQARDNAPVLVLLCPFLANVAQAAFAAFGLRCFATDDAPWRLNTLKKMASFILIVIIAAPALVSFTCAWLFVLAGWEEDYMLVAPARFLNNVVTGFAVAPLLFWIAGGGLAELTRVRTKTYYELTALLAGLAAVLSTISLYPAELTDLPWELYGPVPFLIWAAVRYRPAGVSFTLLIVASHALFETTNGRGAFVQGTPVQNLLSLETSLAVLALPLMLLSALIEEARDKSDALAESEARFRTMADTAPVLIWISGTDKRHHFFNRGWLGFTGRKMSEEIGRGWMAGVHPQDQDGCCQIYENAFDKRKEFTNEYRLRRYDGQYRWILDQGVPRFTHEGALLGYVGCAIDITDRKRAESRSYVQNAVTRILSDTKSIGEASPQILRSFCESLSWSLGEFWLVQRGTGVMSYVNGWHSMSERAHEFLSLTPRLTFSPGVGLPGRVWESRRAEWIRDVADDKNFLRKSVAIQSGLRSALAMPVLLGEEVLGVMVFLAMDVREPDPDLLEFTTGLGSQIGQFIHRKRAEDALRVSEEQLAQARAASSVMVTQSDLDGRWAVVPPSLCSLLGYSPGELVGRYIEDVTHPADLDTNRRHRARLLSGEIKSFDLEKRYLRKDGGVVWVYLNVSTVSDASGKPLYFLSYIKDITERKLAEEALRENELKLKLAMEAARIAYWEVELNSGSVVFSNQADRIFGVGSNSLPRDRNSFFALVHPDDRAGLKSLVAKATDSLSSYDTEYRIVRPDGAVRWIACRGQVLPDEEGRPARVIGLSTDITEHKESEEALRLTLAEVQKLRDRIQAENVYLRTEVARTHYQGELVAESELMQKVVRLVEQVARTDVTVLILGETGTGKEIIARALHERSARAAHQLVTVNCSALPAELIESELFGHEKGAFTGASSRQIGRFEFADGGTIFLDEIGELPLGLQAKLLRVLQEGQFERIGSASTIKVNVRVIAATNRNLTEAVENGMFRSDLFYRLNVYPISVPPLRDRKEDIASLAGTFLREASSKFGKRFERLPAAVIMALEQHYWPGNVRELQNVIERAAVVSTSQALRLPEDWRPISAPVKARSLPSPQQSGPEERKPSRTSSLQEIEREHVIRILTDTHWKVEGAGGAAEILGLQPNTLRSRMKKLGIPLKKDRAKLKSYEN